MKEFIRPLKTLSPIVLDNGCFLSGDKYISRIVGDTLNHLRPILCLSRLSHNPWIALEKITIAAENLKNYFKYECPFSNNTFYSFVPTLIILRNGTKQYQEIIDHPYIFDTEFLKDDSQFELDPIQRSFLGPGYTFATLPNDGDNELKKVLIDLDNNDSIFGYAYVWYNK